MQGLVVHHPRALGAVQVRIVRASPDVGHLAGATADSHGDRIEVLDVEQSWFARQVEGSTPHDRVVLQLANGEPGTRIASRARSARTALHHQRMSSTALGDRLPRRPRDGALETCDLVAIDVANLDLFWIAVQHRRRRFADSRSYPASSVGNSKDARCERECTLSVPTVSTKRHGTCLSFKREPRGHARPFARGERRPRRRKPIVQSLLNCRESHVVSGEYARHG